ncbi:hypothetical protein DealDRAFT_0353 [Dethiobacter alkaliphilus AHT 1]|uniref:Uncharacterized protein n=2 Tax=Dethiobacter TaxID=427925 RepID=C0GCZ4_DETAL|nr:hypothetical protein DealDRAFT_0353 [Dethiobacter alkaliphilus AHT 1]
MERVMLMDMKLFGFLYSYYTVEVYLPLLKKHNPIIRVGDRESLNPDVVPINLRRKLRVLHEILERPGNNQVNIFAEEGTEVIHNGHVEALFEKLEQNARKYLREGWGYTIKTILAFQEHTLVETKEFPGVLFNSLAFSCPAGPAEDIRELLEEYGPELEQDLAKAERLLEEHEKRPILSKLEQLKKLYEEIRIGEKSTRYVDEMPDFMETEIHRPPKFTVGQQFDDGARKIEVLAVGDCPDADSVWHYFIKFSEHDGSGIWYECRDQFHLELYRIADLDCDRQCLNETEQIVQDIVRMHGGAMSEANMPFPAEQPLQLARPPRYRANQVVGRKKILAVSPSLNYSGYWAYFCKENDEYFATDEDGMAWSLR